MCGIAGLWNAGSASEVERRLRTMIEAQAHRGPDDEGMWIDPRGGNGIAHKRLAIIDPSDSGRQPMSNEDGQVQITFNGCIYNYQDLARELRGKGHTFRTHTDTEVIVHAWEEWGEDCVERLNGMFAFAIRDLRQDVLFCARDRIGIKPFYWTIDDTGRFAFASEIKALLAAGLVESAVDSDGLRQYLTFQFCLSDRTLFDGIQKLEPGYRLLLRPGAAPEISRYWRLKFDLDTEHDEPWFVDKLRWLFEDAVRLRLRSDVPLGAHLSGGLDSSTVAGLASMLLSDTSIKTFTGAFAEGPEYDESHYARLVAEQNGAEYLETYFDAHDFASTIEKIIWHLDEPAGGPGVFPQFLVSKLASEHVKVVLGGQGGDEIFIGYARYLVAYLEECLRGAIQNTAHRAHYVATLETIVPSLPTLERYVPMLKSFWSDGLFDEPALRYYRLMDRFADTSEILAPDVVASLDTSVTRDEFCDVFNAPGAASMINRILAFDTRSHLQALLHIEDRTSMAWGLESRVPMLDHRLVEFVATVPPTIKFQNGRLKPLLRQAVQNLVPREIFERKDKMGFPVPLNKWIGGELREFVGDLLLGETSRQRGLFNLEALEKSFSSSQPFSRGLWGAICLELWHRAFIDGGGRATPPAA